MKTASKSQDGLVELIEKNIDACQTYQQVETCRQYINDQYWKGNLEFLDSIDLRKACGDRLNALPARALAEDEQPERIIHHLAA